MIRKNKLGLMVLAIVTTLILSGCSQDAYSGFFSFMGGNFYSDTLDLELPGESSASVEATTENATETEETEVDITDSDVTKSAVEEVNSVAGDDVEGTDDDGNPIAADSNGDGTATVVGSSKVVIIEKETEVPIPQAFEGLLENDLIKVVAVSSKATSGEDGLENVRLLLKANKTTTKKVLGIATVDEDNNQIFTIPMFKVSTPTEQKELAEQYSTQNEVLKSKIQGLMKEEEQDPIKLLAAYNTTVAIENKVRTLESKFDSLRASFTGDTPLGDSGDTISSRIAALTRSLRTPILADIPTREEVLRIKLLYTVTSNLSDAIKCIIQDADGVDKPALNIGTAINDPLVIEKLKKVLEDAETAIAVANLNSDNSDLLAGFDIGSFIEAVSEADKASKSGSKSDFDDALEVLNPILNDNRAAVRLLLSSYIGIKKVGDFYVYDESLNDENQESNVAVFQLINSTLSVSYLAGDDPDAPSRAELYSEELTNLYGLNGLINYSLSFLLANIDKGLAGITLAYNTKANKNYTVKSLIDTYLANAAYTEVLDAIYGTGVIDASVLFEDTDPANTIITQFEEGTGDFKPLSILSDVDGDYFVDLDSYFDACLQFDLNTNDGLGIITEKLEEAKDFLNDSDL